MTRPTTCQVCETFPAHHGVGFPRDPSVNPDLPPHLLGATLWVCNDPECNAKARARARAVAASPLTRLCRVTPYGD